jgi:hypothetical protein
VLKRLSAPRCHPRCGHWPNPLPSDVEHVGRPPPSLSDVSANCPYRLPGKFPSADVADFTTITQDTLAATGGRIDEVLTPIRDNSPDPATEKQTLNDLLTALR